MIDFITALMGGKHCGWCTDKPTSWFDRKVGGMDKLGGRKGRPWWQQAYWLVMDASFNLGVWKLGQRWHWNHHVTEQTCDECEAS